MNKKRNSASVATKGIQDTVPLFYEGRWLLSAQRVCGSVCW